MSHQNCSKQEPRGSMQAVAQACRESTSAAVSRLRRKLKEVDSGTLTLTTKRLVFTGSMESRVVQFKDIVAVQAMGDAIELSVGNKAKREVYLVHNPILWGSLLRTYSNTGKA